jgi:hypothetical protein
MARKQTFSDKFWQDRHGRFVVWQKPNVFLWVWIVATVFNIVLPDSTPERWLSTIGGLAILVWAVLELTRGVNYFRRTLGLCILLLFAASYLL